MLIDLPSVGLAWPREAVDAWLEAGRAPTARAAPFPGEDLAQKRPCLLRTIFLAG